MAANKSSAMARRNGLLRVRPPDDPEVLAADQEVRTEQAAAAIREALAGFPPLTAEQVSGLRAILASAGTDDADDAAGGAA